VQALHAIERGILSERGSARGQTARSAGSLNDRQLLYAPPEDLAQQRTRIAVLNSHPIQYFAPLYAYLNAAPGA
jgi:hypothetical protein